jgi:hypothetical protein
MKRLLLLSIALIFLSAPALSHQPYFEEKDITKESAWHIEDATISTAVYSTLETPDDVDYFTFAAASSQDILLSLTIPQIEGQENFAPTMVLMGPGFPEGPLPSKVVSPEGVGILILPAPDNATEFFEPFSRTSYWTRQEEWVVIPENGTFTVAVYDQDNKIGRYVFVIGDREVLGGDPAFPLKIKGYWTTLEWQGIQNTTSDQTSEIPQPSSPYAQPGFEVLVALTCLAATARVLIERRA